MKKLLLILAVFSMIGCSGIPAEDDRYSVKEFQGHVKYDAEQYANLYLQFYSSGLKDYCEIRLSDDKGQHKYHSESEGYGFPYTLKNKDLAPIIPLVYKYDVE
jgi:hypothetical protein